MKILHFVSLSLSSGKNSEPPKWRCFLRGISGNHLLITLLPASYKDLKLLLVRRANISDASNLALKMLPTPQSNQQHGHTELDTEGNMSEELNVGDLLARGEELLEDGGMESREMIDETFSGGIGRWEQSMSLIGSNIFSPPTTTPPSLGGVSRMRYKSGPALQSPFPLPPGPVPIRERASSLHMGRERGGSFGRRSSVTAERNRASSVDSKDQPQHSTPSTDTRGRTKSVDWHTRDTIHVSHKPPTRERIRQRYVSMPSKSHTCAFTPSIKSSSTEGLKNVDGCIPLHLQSSDLYSQGRGVRMDMSENQGGVGTLDGHIYPTPPLPPPLPRTHTPMYGTVTLPIFIFDCKLSSITAQLINRYNI